VRVLGIDPGSRHLGWGILERTGSKIEHVAHGVIDVNLDGTFADRLVEIDDALGEVIARYSPVDGAVEGLFFSKDAQSAAKLGHARGVVLLRLARSSLRTFEYAPALVKRTVVGRGAADKRQVAMVMTAILRLPSPPRSDAADALAIALTHLNVAGFQSALHASGLSQPSGGKNGTGSPRAARPRRSKVPT
jgi:crossover junction endodeoxyribonuclease RuvC